MTNRSCTRCGRPLEDAASMEAGIGPVCRKMDNAVLAHTFPADVEKARNFLEARGWNNFPEALKPKAAEVEAEIYAVGHGGDWRRVIKRIEYLLSFEEAQAWRNALTEVAAALGYVGLAAIWRGEASTGTAEAFFAPDGNNPAFFRLYVKGSRNTSFRYAIKRIKGWRYEPYGLSGITQGALWSIPATCHEDFLKLIMTYYPRCSNLLDAVKAAQIWSQQATATSATVDTNMARNKECRIEQVNSSGKPAYRVFTPFNTHFINELKQAVPYSGRLWSPQLKCWEIAPQYLGAVQTLLGSYFPNNATPVPTMQPSSAAEQVPVAATPTKASKITYEAPAGLPF